LSVKNTQVGGSKRLKFTDPGRNLSAQFFPGLLHVAHFRTIDVRAVVRHVLQFVITDGHPKTIAKRLEAVDIEFFQTVGLIVGLTRFTHTVAFHCHRQDDRWFVLLPGGFSVSGIDFVGIVTATIQVHNIFIGEVGYQLQQLRVFSEEVLAGIGTTVEFVVLQLAVTDLVHPLLEQSGFVFLQ